MPDNIVFDTIPTDIRTGGAFVEISNRRALRGLPGMPRRMLYIGNLLASGSASDGELNRINNASDAATLFGRGSVLHEMLSAARIENNVSDIWAIGLEDLLAGVKATKVITMGGTPTQAGVISLYVNGTKLSVGVAAADTATVMAASVAAAINAWADAPVTAAAAAEVVTVTAKHKGDFTNGINLRVNYQQDERMPAGVTMAFAAGVTGAGNPDVADALAAISQEAFYTIVMPYSDVSNIAKVEAELAKRWGGMDMRTGHLFFPYAGSHGQISTFGAARNSLHDTFMGVKNPVEAPYIWAAALAAACEGSGAIDPALPFNELPLKSVHAPASADQFTRQERELLLRDGCSTFTVAADGTVLLETIITTYQVNAASIEDVSYLRLNTKWNSDFQRYAFRTGVQTTYQRYKLADDGTNFAPGQRVVTPSMIRGTLLAIGRQLELAGLLENFEQFKNDLVVVRSTTDRNRVNAILSPDLINQFSVFAASVEFVL